MLHFKKKKLKIEFFLFYKKKKKFEFFFNLLLKYRLLGGFFDILAIIN